jgi:hypothetical protein
VLPIKIVVRNRVMSLRNRVNGESGPSWSEISRTFHGHNVVMAVSDIAKNPYTTSSTTVPITAPVLSVFTVSTITGSTTPFTTLWAAPAREGLALVMSISNAATINAAILEKLPSAPASLGSGGSDCKGPYEYLYECCFVLCALPAFGLCAFPASDEACAVAAATTRTWSRAVPVLPTRSAPPAFPKHWPFPNTTLRWQAFLVGTCRVTTAQARRLRGVPTVPCCLWATDAHAADVCFPRGVIIEKLNKATASAFVGAAAKNAIAIALLPI